MMRYCLLATSIAAVFINTAAFADAPVQNIGSIDSGIPVEKLAPPIVSASVQQQVITSGVTLTSDQRLAKVEQQIANMNQLNLLDKINSLQADVDNLRGQVDVLNHTLTQVQSQQKSMYDDLDKRIAALPAATVTAVTPTAKDDTKTPAKLSSTADASQESQVYQAGLQDIKNGNISQAAQTFKEMLKRFSNGQFAARGHYWLGEIYRLQNQPDQAISEYQKLINNFPDNAKAEDAQYKIGLIYSQQKKWDKSRAVLKQVMDKYPGTTSARLAKEQIKEMKQAGQ